MQTNSFLADLFIIQIMYSTDCYHHPIQRLSDTISELAGTHSSYQSTTLAYKALTFSLECYIQLLVQRKTIRTSFLTRAIFPLYCAITFIVLLIFSHLCGTCKTLRLSVFNKELLTYLLTNKSCDSKWVSSEFAADRMARHRSVWHQMTLNHRRTVTVWL